MKVWYTAPSRVHSFVITKVPLSNLISQKLIDDVFHTNTVCASAQSRGPVSYQLRKTLLNFNVISLRSTTLPIILRFTSDVCDRVCCYQQIKDKTNRLYIYTPALSISQHTLSLSVFMERQLLHLHHRFCPTLCVLRSGSII